MKVSFLYGMTLQQGRQLLRYGYTPSLRYLPRAAFLASLGLVNSFYQRKEKKQYQTAVSAVRIDESPLIILGHWRSGTTMLHNLLARDSQFAYPNTYQVMHPNTFLSTEERGASLFQHLAPDSRPQDKVSVAYDLPNEDDVAMCSLTPFSPYLVMAFPQDWYRLLKYITFRGVPEGHFMQWREVYVRFVKKLSLRYRKPLLLKSPPHTGRIKILLDLFPKARFVHIVRNPIRVFQSCRHMFASLKNEAIHLQPHPKSEEIDRLIMIMYRTLHDAYFDEVDSIPDGQFHLLRFEDLVQDPLGELEALYKAVRLEGYQRLAGNLSPDIAAMRQYRQNDYPALDDALETRFRNAFPRQFREWGYATQTAVYEQAAHVE